MDILLQVSEQFLASVADRAGGCVPIGSDEMDSFLSLASDINKPLRLPGGSAANVLKGLANISHGAVQCKFMGMIGRDGMGQDYKHKLAAQNVDPLLLVS
eukprot:jgi/Chrzof1/3395/Cz12g23240.t1